ncbi:transposase [Aneurinibacillus migulanus]|uniref:transposase n=1 Tax=Aneurinibacillus migulanus TaxID=47500 RepID=UPI0009BEF812
MLVLVKIATDYIAHNEPKVEEKDLCIRDLGYFSLGNFKEIEERDAFYVSRLKVNVRVYEKNENMERFKDGQKTIFIQRN